MHKTYVFMTQKDKELLIKDLSARLPYNVYVWFKTRYRSYAITDVLDGAIYTYIETHLLEDDGESEKDIIKPYLRPMSSMTEEEVIEYNLTKAKYIVGYPTFKSFDWLNAHHFDYRGLIKKGLAIAVTEENNPYEN